MSILASFRAALSAHFNSVINKIKKFAYAFLPQVGASVEVAIEDMAQVALQAVVEQAPKVIKGDVKFENAVNTVLSSVAASGRTVAKQTAYAAVQLAYLEAVRIAKENK